MAEGLQMAVELTTAMRKRGIGVGEEDRRGEGKHQHARWQVRMEPGRQRAKKREEKESRGQWWCSTTAAGGWGINTEEGTGWSPVEKQERMDGGRKEGKEAADGEARAAAGISSHGLAGEEDGGASDGGGHGNGKGKQKKSSEMGEKPEGEGDGARLRAVRGRARTWPRRPHYFILFLFYLNQDVTSTINVPTAASMATNPANGNFPHGLSSRHDEVSLSKASGSTWMNPVASITPAANALITKKMFSGRRNGIDLLKTGRQTPMAPETRMEKMAAILSRRALDLSRPSSSGEHSQPPATVKRGKRRREKMRRRKRSTGV